jgi:eIF3 subunit 6 N terminal domain
MQAATEMRAQRKNAWSSTIRGPLFVQCSFRHSSDSIMAVEEAEAVAAAPAGAHKYDLTNTISEYLDLHLMFPLLDFVEISGMYPGQGVAQARLELLEPTNMVRKHNV